MDGKDWSLFVVAKRQHGVISYEQARAVGFTRRAMQWRLNEGEWCRMLPSVVRMYWADDTWNARCWAASLWAGRGAVLSHHTAAKLLGFDVPPSDLVHVTAGMSLPAATKTWLCRHRSRLRPQSIRVSGLPVTAPARTAMDLAGVLAEEEFEQVLRLAIAQRRIAMAPLRRELAKSQRGVAGGAAVRRVFKRLVRE